LETIVLPLEPIALKKGFWFMKFALICVYLVISLLFSLILIGVSFLFASSSSSTYLEKGAVYNMDQEP
jgi:hypothetical protein